MGILLDCFYVIVLDRSSPGPFAWPHYGPYQAPFHPVLQSWSNTWAGLMELNSSEEILESFDKYLPKSQIIIARKE